MNSRGVLGSWFGVVPLVFTILGTSWVALTGAKAYAAPVDWTVAIYAALDEEEIDQFGTPLLKKILGLPLEASVELFVEKDGHGDHGLDRYYRDGNGRSERARYAELDSASPKAFRDFIAWVDAKSTGQRRMMIIMTHAWGWKGVVQDFTVPGAAPDDEDTMMPLRHFGQILREARQKSDILFLDSCVLGNAESLHELRGTARYIVASQRETPYTGYPYEILFQMLGDKRLSAREIARRMPAQYVKAFARGGEHVALEGEHDVVTAVTIDMLQWDDFASDFAELVEALGRAGFRRKLRDNPDWAKQFNDGDGNVDVVELLQRASALTNDPAARGIARRLLRQLGYPTEVAQATAKSYRIKATSADLVRVRIPVDEFLKAPKATEKMWARWKEANKDLPQPAELEYRIEKGYFEVAARLTRGTYEFRPWLAGVSEVSLAARTKSGDWKRQKLTRERDYFVVDDFPLTSLLVSEAHTQGAPFIHGIGVCLIPMMDEKEERAYDIETGQSGPTFYRSLSWNKATGWGDLMLLNR